MCQSTHFLGLRTCRGPLLCTRLTRACKHAHHALVICNFTPLGTGADAPTVLGSNIPSPLPSPPIIRPCCSWRPPPFFHSTARLILLSPRHTFPHTYTLAVVPCSGPAILLHSQYRHKRTGNKHLARLEALKEVTYRGAPEDAPIRSTENPVLVRNLHAVSQGVCLCLFFCGSVSIPVRLCWGVCVVWVCICLAARQTDRADRKRFRKQLC